MPCKRRGVCYQRQQSKNHFVCTETRTGNTINRLAGESLAKKVLQHSTESDTYQKHYDREVEETDIFGLVATDLGEIPDNNTIGRDNSAVVSRIRQRSFDRQVFLGTFVNEDDDVQKLERKQKKTLPSMTRMPLKELRGGRWTTEIGR